VITTSCDLTNAVSRDKLFKRIGAEGRSISMLINVAGIDHEGLFSELTNFQVQDIIRLNIEATLSVTHFILVHRDQQQTFRVINVSSLGAFYPMPVKATYAATKRFLLDFSFALREELRNQDTSVTVLCPAGMPTSQDCIRAIEAQGWAGKVTTMDVGRVANLTLDAALKGKSLVITGLINFIVKVVGSLIPPALIARFIGRRWKSVHEARKLQKEFLTA
jgi:uncharacterized protein